MNFMSMDLLNTNFKNINCNFTVKQLNFMIILKIINKKELFANESNEFNVQPGFSYFKIKLKERGLLN